eukprot:CAMPEP_0117449524 /NCGR_PEP_ID=MMETSP0759-20121206/7990_1 /TAXON_ID=63605 /ORGANISM="Percolomonas cosmopolitus, Strain WS" /LENGTH=652 /DNA_ID=CAMNT_0005242003 /DNA_START=9 /DNA_END=1967 /DNA_ORIENTATION=-
MSLSSPTPPQHQPPSDPAPHRLLPYLSTISPSYSPSLTSAPILLIGAGGIGCELLKNLVLSGFRDIEVIDLDTIDVSNLNRQFLFRQEHVGRSKSEVAKESVLRFVPHKERHLYKITPHHANVKSSHFSVDYFQRFKVVMNALDNVSARQHVNRMCLAADVPLLDGGTAGYLGQVMTIQKGRTECYECQPKQREQSFAVCTIRSNPSTLLHCVVWAKMLFERLFGKSSDENAIADFETIQKIQDARQFSESAFDLVFRLQVDEAKDMKDTSVFHAGKRPVPILMDNLVAAGKGSSGENGDNNTTNTSSTLLDQQVWNLHQCATIFLDCAQKLRQLKISGTQKDMSFDKDNEMAMDFVTAASNLRAHNYHIEPKSKYEVKGMAGNIVPAIATTNAIISGLLVLETFKVLQGRMDQCRAIFCLRNTCRYKRKNCLLYPISLEKPNPNCYICSSNEVTVRVNTQTTSLQYFVDNILRRQLGMVEPTITFQRQLLFECGEELEDDEKEEYEENGKKTLAQLKIASGEEANRGELAVEDYAQDMDWKVIVLNDENIEREEAEIVGKVEHEKAANTSAQGGALPGAQEAAGTTAETTVTKSEVAMTDENGVVDLISDDEDETSRKRKREQHDHGDTNRADKRKKIEEEPEENIIELSD